VGWEAAVGSAEVGGSAAAKEVGRAGGAATEVVETEGAVAATDNLGTEAWAVSAATAETWGMAA
jgi:hypothetical protein